MMYDVYAVAGLIDDVPTCKVLVERIVAEAETQLAMGSSRVVASL